MWRMVVAVLLLGLSSGCASERTCAEIDADAQELLTSSQSCTMDTDCVVTTTPAECLVPFLCSVVVNKKTDLDELKAHVKRLSEEHLARCNSCAASCLDPSQFSPACENGVCGMKPR